MAGSARSTIIEGCDVLDVWDSRVFVFRLDDCVHWGAGGVRGIVLGREVAMGFMPTMNISSPLTQTLASAVQVLYLVHKP